MAPGSATAAGKPAGASRKLETGFVGREREMERLETALARAMNGEGRMLMLAGEPGIGKTRTAEELVHRARETGAEVLWGGCYEGEGAPLFWPWAQVLREYARGRPSTELRRLMGPRAPIITAAFPEIAERLRGLAPPTHLDDPVSARFRLFDAFWGFHDRGRSPGGCPPHDSLPLCRTFRWRHGCPCSSPRG